MRVLGVSTLTDEEVREIIGQSVRSSTQTGAGLGCAFALVLAISVAAAGIATWAGGALLGLAVLVFIIGWLILSAIHRVEALLQSRVTMLSDLLLATHEREAEIARAAVRHLSSQRE